MPGPLASLLTLLLAAIVIGCIGYFVVLRVIDQMPQLADQFANTVQHLRQSLNSVSGGKMQLDHLESETTQWLQQHRASVIGYVSTGASDVAKAVTGVILTLFITFFLL